MNRDELLREASIAMAALKTTAEAFDRCDPFILMHWPLEIARTTPRKALEVVRPGEWARLPLPGPLLDSGPAKSEIFGMYRCMVALTGADAVIICTDIWRGRATAEGQRHAAEFNRHVDRGFARLVKMGWAVRESGLNVTAQSAEDVVQLFQGYRRRATGIEFIGKTESMRSTQAEFGGRQKMFGVTADSDLGEPPEGSYADKHNRGEA